MNHLETYEAETFVSTGERAWLAFVACVERLLGHDLDGDQDRDGYSIDFALLAFEVGTTASDYALQVQAARASVHARGAGL